MAATIINETTIITGACGDNFFKIALTEPFLDTLKGFLAGTIKYEEMASVFREISSQHGLMISEATWDILFQINTLCTGTF